MHEKNANGTREECAQNEVGAKDAHLLCGADARSNREYWSGKVTNEERVSRKATVEQRNRGD